MTFQFHVASFKIFLQMLGPQLSRQWEKSEEVQVSAQLGGHVSPSTLSAHQMATPVSTWIADKGDTWKMVHSARVGTYWVNQVTYDSQWHPLTGPGATASPGRYISTGHGRGSCLAVHVCEIMQRLFQHFSDRRGCNPCCTVVNVPVSCSDVQVLFSAMPGSTVDTCSGHCWCFWTMPTFST